MSLVKRQTVFARFLDDPLFEARVRAAPEMVTESMGVDEEFGRYLASLDPKRVAAFRASQRVKARRRGD